MACFLQNSHSLLCDFKVIFIVAFVGHSLVSVTLQSRNRKEGGYFSKRCLLKKLLILFHVQSARF